MKQINIDAAYRKFLNSDEGQAPESVKTGYSEFTAMDRCRASGRNGQEGREDNRND